MILIVQDAKNVVVISIDIMNRAFCEFIELIQLRTLWDT